MSKEIVINFDNQMKVNVQVIYKVLLELGLMPYISWIKVDVSTLLKKQYFE